MKYITIYSLIALASLLFLSCNKEEQQPNGTFQLEKWNIAPSIKANASGAKISTISFDAKNWHPTTVPSTVLNALIQNNVYENIFYGDNLEQIPSEQFRNPWWYRTSFKIDKLSDQDHHQIVFEGINYKANIWLNGKQIEDTNNVRGPFSMPVFDISESIQSGNNVLAVEVFPPAKDDLTIGFVDWNPAPADNNMGIWRNVYLKHTYNISIENVYVQTDVDTKTNQSAEITISFDLENQSAKEQKVSINGQIENIRFSKEYSLHPNEIKRIELNAKNCPELHIQNPRLWWPNNMGEPNLYNLNLQAKNNGLVSDKENVRFGIREIEQYVNKEGHKGYKINGQKVLIRGGGWVDDIFLSDSDEKVKAQIDYVKHMNLNTIRLEGFWGKNKSIYNYADENGILIMIGWSCHWEWNNYCNRKESEYMCIYSDKDIEEQAQAYMDQVKWLRNHPSVFLWVYGSDKLPHPKLEKRLNTLLEQLDTTRPVLASCKNNTSEISGPAGVKMVGPYAYQTPNYWYIDKSYGGAYGFNTETGPGPQVPPLESIKKMIPEENLWPINEMWEYHCGRHEFQSLDRFLNAYNKRYGKASSVEEFALEVQQSNYEAIRAMFEAFAVNTPNATGVIQWMLNSAWPEMFWQLYDYYLMPNGAFYGTQKACHPLHLIYNYGDKSIYISNEHLESFENLKAEIQYFDINSKPIANKTIKVSIAENSSKKIAHINVPKETSNTYFVNLNLYDKSGNKISNNFYWLSKKEDVHEFDRTTWFYTPYKSFADFTQINNMPQAKVDMRSSEQEKNGSTIFTVVLTNTSDVIAHFIELQIKDKETDKSILPVFWDDNYISLLPGEKRSINVAVQKSQTHQPVISIQGVNLKNE